MRKAGRDAHHGVSTLSLERTKRFDPDPSLVQGRIAKPGAGSDGIQPKPADFRRFLGLGVDLRHYSDQPAR
jgi:hypothetical protein